MTDKLTFVTLESWQWELAAILRGSIDSSDFKNSIFDYQALKRGLMQKLLTGEWRVKHDDVGLAA